MLSKKDNVVVPIDLVSLFRVNKNETLVKYTLPEDNKTIFSSEFRLTIPSEKEFIDVIENEKKNMELVWFVL